MTQNTASTPETVVPNRTRLDAYKAQLETLKDYGNYHSTLGNRMLKALWTIYSERLYSTEGGHESFEEFIELELDPFFEDTDYLWNFVYVTTKVLHFIHVRRHSQDPLIDPETGDGISVEWILEQRGWIGKLISLSQAMDTATKEEEKAQLIQFAVNNTRQAVKEEGQRIRQGRLAITISILERLHANGTSTMTMKELSSEQRTFLLRKLGSAADIHLD